MKPTMVLIRKTLYTNANSLEIALPWPLAVGLIKYCSFEIRKWTRLVKQSGTSCRQGIRLVKQGGDFSCWEDLFCCSLLRCCILLLLLFFVHALALLLVAGFPTYLLFNLLVWRCYLLSLHFYEQ